MPRAVLVLADLYPTGALPDLAAIRRLPFLERTMARAACHGVDEPGWRAWLRRRLGAELQPAGDAPGYWLATPVHHVAGLDTLRLHGNGLLRLPLPVQRRLADDFERTFRGSGWQLIATGARELLLQGPSLAAEAPDPALFLGQSTRDAQPQGDGKAELRRVQSEIEMWLHSADFRGVQGGETLKVNGLWLWGRSYVGPLSRRSDYAGRRPGVTSGQLYSDDLGARACAAAVGMAQSGLPQRWPSGSDGQSDRYVVLNIAGVDIAAQVEDFTQRWLEPAVAARAAGHYATLELVCAGRRWALDSAARWRFWRRRQHWLPELLPC